MCEYVVNNDSMVAGIISLTNSRLNELKAVYIHDMGALLDQQGQLIDECHNLVNKVDLINKDPNLSLLIKGQNPIYISLLDIGVDEIPVSLQFDGGRKPSSSNSVSLILNAGLSAVFETYNADELYIRIKKNLVFKGEYYGDAPSEIIKHTEPQDVPVFKLLDQLSAYIKEYPNGTDKFDAMLNGVGIGNSLLLDVNMYLQEVLDDYDMKLRSIECSVDDNELYLKFSNPDFALIGDAFKVSEESIFNDFNVEIYEGFK